MKRRGDDLEDDRTGQDRTGKDKEGQDRAGPTDAGGPRVAIVQQLKAQRHQGKTKKAMDRGTGEV